MDPELEKAMLTARERGYSDAQITKLYNDWTAAHGSAAAPAAPQPTYDTSLSPRNIGRSVLQGGLFHFGDELGLVDPAKDAAFGKAHPVVDFISKLGGSLVAPAVAVAAAPEALAGLAGAAGLGAAAGGLDAAGASQGGFTGRAEAAGMGAAAGGLFGAGGFGLGRLTGKLVGKALDRLHPERPVARALADLIEPSDVRYMQSLNKQAPGTASLASSSMPPNVPGVRDIPRMLTMARALGASPDAARSTERQLVTQHAAISAQKRVLGAQMDAMPQRLQLTPELRAAMGKVQGVLGGRAPDVPPPPPTPSNIVGLEQTIPFSAAPDVPTDMSTAEVRSSLSELRDIARKGQRGLAERGAGGVRMGDVKAARNALHLAVYDQIPEFGDLDRQYSQQSQQGRNVVKLLNATLDSRRNYTGNTAFSASSGSLGASLPSGRQGVALAALENMLENRAGAADVIAKYTMQPGATPSAIKNLLKFAKPPSVRGAAMRNAGVATIPPALRGLLFPADSPDQ